MTDEEHIKNMKAMEGMLLRGGPVYDLTAT